MSEAVIKINGMLAVAGCDRKTAKTCKPFTSGILTSDKIKSGIWAIANWIPTCPFSAPTTSKPRDSRISNTISRIKLLSSITNIFVIFLS